MVQQKDPKEYVGMAVKKHFGKSLFSGIVTSVSEAGDDPSSAPLWFVTYEDGDKEEMSLEQLKRFIVTENATTPRRRSAATAPKSLRGGLRAKPTYPVGRSIIKKFNNKPFKGTVAAISNPDPTGKGGVWWRVEYEDGDSEEMTLREIERCMVAKEPVSAAPQSAKKRKTTQK